MCGICGYVSISGQPLEPSDTIIRRMNSVLIHRGPDQEGYHLDATIRLGVRRLSIQDIAGGSQPVYSEDRSVVVVFNGEIYNFKELRAELVARGHRFRSQCDTEVVVHLYEERGTDCLEALNGQFAFLLWDAKARRLFAARDRVGKKPLFYARLGDVLVLASEIKSILMHPLARREIDRRCLDQVFTFFMPVNPRTMFKDVVSLTPGTWLEIRNGSVQRKRYWEPPVPDLRDTPTRPDHHWIEQLRGVLTSAVSDRLVADVPVGVFLSGGLDSSVIAAIAARCSPTPVQTYSIAHSDPYYDESPHSDLVARALKTSHRRLNISADDVAALLPTLVWRVEAPSCKTSNAAYMLLYKMARETSTVILTGEGADETFGGYPNVRMLKAQEFSRRHPRLPGAQRLMERVLPQGSTLRVMYHEPKTLSNEEDALVRRRFGCIPADLQRFRSLAALKPLLFSEETLAELRDFSAEDDVAEALVNPDLVRDRHYIQQAQYFEYLLKLPNYLLINPGDRAAMTHSVENRCPFLDRRLIELCMTLPLRLRVRALTEKYILRKAFEGWLPRGILARTKRPFTTFFVSSLFRENRIEPLKEAISERAVKRAGLFNPAAVEEMKQRLRGPALTLEEQLRIETPFALVVTSQLWYQMYIEDFRPQGPS